MTDNHMLLLCEHSHCSWRWEASKERIRQNLWENQDQSQNTRLRGHSDSFVLCWHLILHDFLFYCSIKMSSKPLPRNPLGVFSAHTVLLFVPLVAPEEDTYYFCQTSEQNLFDCLIRLKEQVACLTLINQHHKKRSSSLHCMTLC